MQPKEISQATGLYGAPAGLEDAIGGLPYWRETRVLAGREIPEIYSVWEPSPAEREAIAAGADVVVSQIGEPIRPMTVGVYDEARGGRL